MKHLKKIICSLCMVTVLGQQTSFAASIEPYMTYRDNAVKLTTESGIEIVSGQFQVAEFCITSGQDPNGENEVGRIHELENGQFHFQVGRKGSEEVANWFNERFSGYNDDAVNGDRTTFDHTADKLNFAFVGELNLEVVTESLPDGIVVSFDDVVFAQGSTLFSNNWWFGQKQGQHTLDSDGPNRMLALGSTDEGKQVFASFLRGGNDVNEVTLCALQVVDEPIDKATSIEDVRTVFSNLPADGTQVDLNGFPGSYDPIVNHIQGYSLYEREEIGTYSIITHSVSTADYAHIVAGQVNSDVKYGYKTYMKGWQHPGGIQTIGDYLLVPSEQEDSAQISMYDLRTLAVGELRRVETFGLSVPHKVGSLGITTYEDKAGNEYYLMVAAHLNGSNSKYHVYRADADRSLEFADFSEVGSFTLDKDFQGMGLVTENTAGNVYLIGLLSIGEGISYTDYAYLYQLDTVNWTFSSALAERHLISSGGAAGVLGVHFRYGAGVSVNSNGELTISATERNSVLGSTLATNDWVHKQSTVD